jgi:hypothetical protein
MSAQKIKISGEFSGGLFIFVEQLRLRFEQILCEDE